MPQPIYQFRYIVYLSTHLHGLRPRINHFNYGVSLFLFRMVNNTEHVAHPARTVRFTRLKLFGQHHQPGRRVHTPSYSLSYHHNPPRKLCSLYVVSK